MKQIPLQRRSAPLQAENQKPSEYAQSLLQHVDQLLAASREKDESTLALQHSVDAMNAKDAKTQTELQTRADVISKLEESDATLQQKRLAEGEWKVQDTYTANHVQALVAQMEEERTISAAGVGHTRQYSLGGQKNYATWTKEHTSVQYESR